MSCFHLRLRKGVKLNILFVNSTRKWGGVKSWTMDFASALQERGHRIVCILRPGTDFYDACCRAGFEVYPLTFGPKYNPVAIVRALILMRRIRPDICVVNISKDLEVGAVAAKMLGIPVVHRVGRVDDYKGSREERWRHRNLVSKILVPGRLLADGIISKFSWIKRDDVVVIHNSKRLDKYKKNVPRTVAPVIFGISGQLSDVKGHTYLLDVMKMVLDKGIDSKLKIAGQGVLRPSLEKQVEELGIGDAVEFCGFLTDIPAFLAELDVFVISSLNEGFPNSLLEAVACGLPVAGFASDGVVEIAEDFGLLTPIGDTGQLARSMMRLANDSELRESLGNTARQAAEELYDLNVNTRKLEAFFSAISND